MVKEAEAHAEADKRARRKVEAKASLEAYIANIKRTLSDKSKIENKLDDEDMEKLHQASDDGNDWIRRNR
jgi:molecular chaperone DnaK (HSP70)